MKKFISKKPKIIEAEQFLPPNNIPSCIFMEDAETGTIMTIQGQWVKVKSGEWIVREDENPDRYYPIANTVKENLYKDYHGDIIYCEAERVEYILQGLNNLNISNLPAKQSIKTLIFELKSILKQR